MPRKGESIYKRRDGRWEARYIHHYENGKARYRFLYAATYSEVKAKRLEEQSLPENFSAPIIKRNAKFYEVATLWLADRKPSVKESTYTRYFRTVQRYLNPTLGERTVYKIDFFSARSFLQNLSEKGGVTQMPLSNKTVSDILCILKSIFKYGKSNGYPCIDLSMLQAPPQKQRHPLILPAEDRKIIEQQLLNSEDRICLGILFTLYTGVRIGELCGLRWGDIDLKNRTVAVQRTVERISDLSPGAANKTKLVIAEPKTENSLRIIPIPAFLAEHMQKFVRTSDCYLLTGTGKPTEPHQYYLRYKTVIRRYGLEKYTFHALRHTFATRCVENGFDAKSLSEILGHAHVSTTLAVYVHPTLEQKREQMERLTPSAYL